MYDFDKPRRIMTNDTISMPAPVIERPRRITAITISAMLAMARMVVSEVPQALFNLLGKISLYSFVLTFHLAFVIYHSTKPSSDDARGSRKPGQPGITTRDYRFLSMKLSSGVLGELVSPYNEAGTNCSLLRSSTISSEITRHSPSHISIATLVERANLSQEAADAYPATPVLTRKHGTIFPDSVWATMNSTQIRRIRRAVKRVKYKEEHGLLPRGVRSKALVVTKTSKKEEENIMENSREHEQKINEEDKQEDNDNDNQMKDDKEDDQKFVEKYHEGVKEDDDEGFEGVDEDFMKKDDEVKEGATAGDNELTEDDSRDVREQFASENEDMKENVAEDEDTCLEEDFMKSEEDVTTVDIKGVEANVAVYEITIVGEIFTVNDNECVDESVKKYNVLEEHNEVIVNEDDNQDHTKTTADGTCKLAPPTHHRNLDLRNSVTMIPSLIKGWPPVLLSESIIDKLDPIDFKIMQLECEYHLSRE
ncbi:hypothetical protein BDR07DRAFT_1412984 [Suillus spraguei]|nr:hypothetical protein BDR07DRAFT_1412984 [Suillus spraguei]